jgi:hypothetical protein
MPALRIDIASDAAIEFSQSLKSAVLPADSHPQSPEKSSQSSKTIPAHSLTRNATSSQSSLSGPPSDSIQSPRRITHAWPGPPGRVAMNSFRPASCSSVLLLLIIACSAPGCAGKHYPRAFYMYPQPAGSRFFPEDDFPQGPPVMPVQQQAQNWASIVLPLRPMLIRPPQLPPKMPGAAQPE